MIFVSREKVKIQISRQILAVTFVFRVPLHATFTEIDAQECRDTRVFESTYNVFMISMNKSIIELSWMSHGVMCF